MAVTLCIPISAQKIAIFLLSIPFLLSLSVTSSRLLYNGGYLWFAPDARGWLGSLEWEQTHLFFGCIFCVSGTAIMALVKFGNKFARKAVLIPCTALGLGLAGGLICLWRMGAVWNHIYPEEWKLFLYYLAAGAAAALLSVIILSLLFVIRKIIAGKAMSPPHSA